jgi:hypothetical protein
MSDLLQMATEVRKKAHELLLRVEALDHDMRTILSINNQNKRKHGRTIQRVR